VLHFSYLMAVNLVEPCCCAQFMRSVFDISSFLLSFAGSIRTELHFFRENILNCLWFLGKRTELPVRCLRFFSLIWPFSNP
jgi:hypothetical protein